MSSAPPDAGGSATVDPAPTRAPASAHAPIGPAEAVLLLAGAAYFLGPWRSFPGDMAACLLGGLLLAVSRRAGSPAPAQGEARSVLMGHWLGTAVAAGLLLAYGVARGAPTLTPQLLAVTCAVYLPFAFLQQYLTQGYLVGRLTRRVCGDSDLRLALVGGVAFGLCHLPFPDLVLPTMAPGCAWAWVYLRSGRLAPVAVSHALLGSAFFLAVLQRDPFAILGLS